MAMVVYVVQCLELSFKRSVIELGTGGDYYVIISRTVLSHGGTG